MANNLPLPMFEILGDPGTGNINALGDVLDVSQDSESATRFVELAMQRIHGAAERLQQFHGLIAQLETPPEGQITRLIVEDLPQTLVALDQAAQELMLARQANHRAENIMFNLPEPNVAGAGVNAEPNPNPWSCNIL